MRLKHLYHVLLLTACYFQASYSFCQPLENHFTHYTTKNGLSDGVIRSIAQDSTGFLWLATDNGLCRFDGHTFKNFRYTPGDTTSLCENRLEQVFIDSHGRVWAICFNWLFLFHPEGEWIEHFNIDGFYAEKICREENGQLVIASGAKGLYKFDIAQKKFSGFYREGMPATPYFDCQKDDKGIEWFSIPKKLIRYDPNTKQQRLIFPCSGSIIVLSDSLIIARTFDQGLLLINRQTLAVKQFLPDKKNPNSIPDASIPYMYRLNDSIILLATNTGLSVFNWKTETFTNIVPEKANPQSLAEANLRACSIFCDREGILWIGGKHLDKQDFKNFNIRVIPSTGKEHSQKMFYPSLNLYLTMGGKFLMGSYGGLKIYDPLKDKLSIVPDKQFNPEKPEKYKLVECVQEDRHGNLWCVNWPHFSSFKINGDRIVNIHQHNFPFQFRLVDMKMDKKGCLLISTVGRGLLRFDPSDSSYTIFDTSAQSPARLTSMNIGIICVASDGSIWLSTLKGINKIGSDGHTVKQFGPNIKYEKAIWAINDIKEDRHGIIWFSTIEHGIGRIDPTTDSVTMLSIDHGLPTCFYDKICIDDNNNLWVISKMGILRINTLTLQSQLYTENEGFPLPDDITDMDYSEFTKKLNVLTDYGIYEINSAYTNYKPGIPKTYITGFYVFDKEKRLQQNNTVNLKYNENFINIQFAALLFHSNDQIKYAYKMEGVDNDWVYCNFKRNASYTNLPPGHYIFQVKSQNPEGIWSNTPTTLYIYIKSPFWQTWWFYLAELLCVIAFILWVTRLYTTKKLAKQKNEIEKSLAVSNERTRIASDMHDDLGAGLTSIRLLSEIANQKTGKDSTAKTEIEKIALAAGNLSDNLREIIWAINTSNDILEDFIIYVRAYAVEYFDNTQIKFEFYRPDLIPYVPMKGELRRNMFLCIKEALHNIVKHAHATKASLTFEIIENHLIIIITDNGIGINLAQVRKFGNGLNIMKERLRKLGTTLEIETGNGTKLTFKIAFIL